MIFFIMLCLYMRFVVCFNQDISEYHYPKTAGHGTLRLFLILYK